MCIEHVLDAADACKQTHLPKAAAPFIQAPSQNFQRQRRAQFVSEFEAVSHRLRQAIDAKFDSSEHVDLDALNPSGSREMNQSQRGKAKLGTAVFRTQGNPHLIRLRRECVKVERGLQAEDSTRHAFGHER
jgi:hypothetical protein